ncbi:vWA domain-containing protein [Sporosarcina obsidiansis]|uniref:vWA domain-containing protein n=1 Tax=Sporosarcina obsidiansis TaxID=2660748 RepID=UPI00129B9FD6|nr:VWA domain-containing protein [Sporosarcina obsidiansis]
MKKLLYVLFCLLVMLAGCSSKEEPKVQEQTQKEDEVQEKTVETEADAFEPTEPEYYEIEGVDRELSDVEKDLLRKPGIFSGENYDEEKVNEAINQWPDGLTLEQYLNEMLHLVGEDYYDGMKTLLTFDTSVEVDHTRPDEQVNQPALKTAHYAILIDASGSMRAMAGGKTRMDSAKDAVLDFAKQIPEDATLSMRVYGHKGSGNQADKQLSCTSTENFYSGKFEETAFRKALGKVRPAGWTPIGLVLETVKEDIPEDAEEVVVYVVSDGIETCGGDPVKAAGDLVAGNIETVVNIIGYDVDNEGQILLKKVADAGNGEFIYVNSEKELRKYMRAQYEAIQKQWWEWKETSKKDAWDQKENLKELSWDTKKALQKQSLQEKERLKEARAYLKTKYKDSDTIIKLSNYLIEDQHKKYNYITKKGNELYNESIKNGHETYNQVIKEGHEKHNEAARKKHQQ